MKPIGHSPGGYRNEHMQHLGSTTPQACLEPSATTRWDSGYCRSGRLGSSVSIVVQLGRLAHAVRQSIIRRHAREGVRSHSTQAERRQLGAHSTQLHLHSEGGHTGAGPQMLREGRACFLQHAPRGLSAHLEHLNLSGARVHLARQQPLSARQRTIPFAGGVELCHEARISVEPRRSVCGPTGSSPWRQLARCSSHTSCIAWTSRSQAWRPASSTSTSARRSAFSIRRRSLGWCCGGVVRASCAGLLLTRRAFSWTSARCASPNFILGLLPGSCARPACSELLRPGLDCSRAAFARAEAPSLRSAVALRS
eukprot:4848239-Prymnesium_polylepis.1